jgi:hypothetical protein
MTANTINAFISASKIRSPMTSPADDNRSRLRALNQAPITPLSHDPFGRENDMENPATEKRGGNPDVKHKPEHQKPKDAMERKLEQGLEESMTGSDPVSVTQPPKIKHHEKNEE